MPVTGPGLMAYSHPQSTKNIEDANPPSPQLLDPRKMQWPGQGHTSERHTSHRARSGDPKPGWRRRPASFKFLQLWTCTLLPTYLFFKLRSWVAARNVGYCKVNQ